jgi:hypothetical protein
VINLNRRDLTEARSIKFKRCLDALEQGRLTTSSFEHFKMALEDDAEFAGGARILFFDLFSALAKESGTASVLSR